GRDLPRNDLGTLDRIGGELATRIEEPHGPQLAVSVAQRHDYHRCDFQIPGFQFAGERQAADIGEYLGPASTHRLDDCRVFARRKCDAMQALEPRAGSATYLVVPCPVKCGDADAVTIEDRDHGGGSGLEDSLGLALLGQRAGQGLPLSLEFGGELQLRVRLLEGAGSSRPYRSSQLRSVPGRRPVSRQTSPIESRGDSRLAVSWRAALDREMGKPRRDFGEISEPQG